MPDTLPTDRDWRRHWDGGAPLADDALVQVGRTVGASPSTPLRWTGWWGPLRMRWICRRATCWPTCAAATG
uniref:Uncharacterized protein n=1 Tax=Phenylobacterium glaciei TaxID=2803784 RepID=A0A974P4S1_9CAUL|nr:hypothetical protein JKL49_01370 [Phenylobacterium glaciei]